MNGCELGHYGHILTRRILSSQTHPTRLANGPELIRIFTIAFEYCSLSLHLQLVVSKTSAFSALGTSNPGADAKRFSRSSRRGASRPWKFSALIIAFHSSSSAPSPLVLVPLIEYQLSDVLRIVAILTVPCSAITTDSLHPVENSIVRIKGHFGILAIGWGVTHSCYKNARPARFTRKPAHHIGPRPRGFLFLYPVRVGLLVDEAKPVISEKRCNHECYGEVRDRGMTHAR